MHNCKDCQKFVDNYTGPTEEACIAGPEDTTETMFCETFKPVKASKNYTGNVNLFEQKKDPEVKTEEKPEPKKRGPKPKVKIENVPTPTEPKKKRGPKPKEKAVEEVVPEKSVDIVAHKEIFETSGVSGVKEAPKDSEEEYIDLSIEMCIATVERLTEDINAVVRTMRLFLECNTKN